MRDDTGPNSAVDPRAVRVSVAGAPAISAPDPIVLEPAAIPLVPVHHGPEANIPAANADAALDLLDRSPPVVIDGAPASARIERRDTAHAVLVERGTVDEGDRTEARRTPVVMLPTETSAGGTVTREVVVDGWRIVVEIESEQRARLRERARRGRDEAVRGGRTEIRAVIPGRILSVSVAPGDAVTLGQQVMVVEAMKMQNEVRAPRDGVVGRVEVGPGRTVELGDLLVVIE